MITEKLYSIGTPLVNHLWQSTIFAVLAAMLTCALKRNRARVRYWVWLTASVKFLFPFSLLMIAGSHLAKWNRPPQALPAFSFVVQAVSQPFHQVSLSGLWLPWLPPTLAVFWLAGFVTVTGLYTLHWWRATRLVRASRPMCQGREAEALRQRERLAVPGRPIALRVLQGSTEPAVFGITRPTLLWPAAISDHLQDAHIEAILAHEVEHVRLHDNLTAALHMLVEAVFWFHPLVWCIGARLMEERERACDEAVVRQGTAPEIYAESLLKTCEFCVVSQLACISGVTGDELKERIVRIMSQPERDTLTATRRLLLTAIAIAAVAAPLITGVMQTPLLRAQARTANANLSQATDTGLGTLEKPYHVGGDISAPKLIHFSDPEYTEKARRAKYQGVCVVTLVVDTEGNPQKVRVTRHLGMGLDNKALEAVRQYRFTPALKAGKPVDVQVNIELNFRIH